MDESELAAVALALRQLQTKPQEDALAVSAWQLSARLPELEFEELRALSRRCNDVP